jgi:hypothetical protein
MKIKKRVKLSKAEKTPARDMTGGLSDEELQLLLLTPGVFIARHPQLIALEKLLKEIAAQSELVLPMSMTPDPNVQDLLDRGFVMEGPVQFQIMEKFGCHLNVAQLWQSKELDIVGCAIGYALDDSEGRFGWRQHSWGVRRSGGIIETTSSRIKYFGVLMQTWEADEFAEHCVSLFGKGSEGAGV